MGKLAWSQLRFRTVRLLALVAGMVVATAAFTVLTSASRTAQLRTVGTVSAHFVPAYDILVRPQGAQTSLEQREGTVQPNFLSGIYGGITMAQYEKIARITGVQVAAPIAMVGYTLLLSRVDRPLPAAQYARPGRQLYRIATSWVSDDGTSHIAQPPSYLYVTPNKLRTVNSSGALSEELPGGGSAQICPAGLPPRKANPFGVAVQSETDCRSTANSSAFSGSSGPRAPAWGTRWVIPVLMAAVDPVAEARLDGLDHALTSGRYLGEHAEDRTSGLISAFPVLAASTSGVDEIAVTQLQQLAAPDSPPAMDEPWLAREAAAPGHTVTTVKTTEEQAYRNLLTTLRRGVGSHAPHVAVLGYWSVGPTRYHQDGSGQLTPVQVDNRASVWYTGGTPDVSMDDEDNQYRKLVVHAPATESFSGALAVPQVVGVFDPARIKSFDPLSRVPLGAYQPTTATAANPASRTALGGQELRPNQNLGGYISQPVDLITSLSALPALQNAGYYGSNLPVSDPISVIRVRVSGVRGPDPVSLERIREVAQQIAVRTHLDVDIVAGSSPAPTAISLPGGKFGQPPLSLREDWVKKGVAVAILTAIDKNSLVLFILILVVCVLFVANSASAAVRGRRRELGVLACLGWTKPRLFATVLAELGAIGLVAGMLGAVVALPLSDALGLRTSPGRTLLAIPIAVAVAVLAGLIPAWLAARADPVASVRPAVLDTRRSSRTSGVLGMAATNVVRTPGRALVGAASLAVGVAALTALTGVTAAFRGVVIGSLLGDAVSVQVRGVDYIAVAATLVLGLLAVADVLLLNITERAAELATIRSFGWRESALGRLVVTEGAIIGLAGSAVGAGLGLLGAAEFAGQLPVQLYLVAAVAVSGGVVVTACAALVPAQALRRLPAAHLLAEE